MIIAIIGASGGVIDHCNVATKPSPFLWDTIRSLSLFLFLCLSFSLDNPNEGKKSDTS